MSKSPIIISGIHRSGTSLMSKIFESSDVFLGEFKDVNNESIFFQNINKWIMSSFDSSWSQPVIINNEDILRYNMLLYKINKILKSRLNYKFFGFSKIFFKKNFFNLNMNWGWKDPRNIFTLPIWMDIFPESKIIIVLRHPFDVVNSLVNRNIKLIDQDMINKDKFFNYFLIPLLNINNYSNLSIPNMTFSRGMKIYDLYFKQIQSLKLSFSDHILIVKYEDLISNKINEITKVLNFCNLDFTNKNKLFIETIYKDRMYNFRLENKDQYMKYNDKLIEYGYLNES